MQIKEVRERIANAKSWLFDTGEDDPRFDLATEALQPLHHTLGVMRRIAQFKKWLDENPGKDDDTAICLIVAGLEQALDECGHANGRLRQRVPNPSGEFEPPNYESEYYGQKKRSRTPFLDLYCNDPTLWKFRKALKAYITRNGYREYLVLAHFMSEDDKTGGDSKISKLTMEEPELIDGIIDGLESLFITPPERFRKGK